MQPLTWRQRLGLYALRARKVLPRLLVILLLTDVAFIFVAPILRMVSMSFMGLLDLYDPTVEWIPRHVDLGNYERAVLGLAYWRTLRDTSFVALVCACLQTLSCALVGYGFARIEFPGRDKLFMLVLFALIVPPHAIIIQLFILYGKLPAYGITESGKWLYSYLPFIVPSALSMGLRGALFVFIFRQFFKGMPWELEDAARIDGAGPLRVFFDVMLPPARPAIIVVFLFSFVWNWNNSLEPTIYLKETQYLLPQRLSFIETALANAQYRAMWGEAAAGTAMAAALLVILPLLILYVFTQRYFVESIERTGLIG